MAPDVWVESSIPKADDGCRRGPSNLLDQNVHGPLLPHPTRPTLLGPPLLTIECQKRVHLWQLRVQPLTEAVHSGMPSPRGFCGPIPYYLHRKNPRVAFILRMYCRTYLPDGLECRDTAFPIAGHVFSNRIGMCKNFATTVAYLGHSRWLPTSPINQLLSHCTFVYTMYYPYFIFGATL
jgi:hypothetical protein